MSPILPAGATLAPPFADEGGAAFGLTGITPVLVQLKELVAVAPAGDDPYDPELLEDEDGEVVVSMPVFPELARPIPPPAPVAPVPALADPEAPGPFAFADPNRVRDILESAGFAEIEITARDEQVGSGDLDAMLAVCSRVGALGKILRENPELRATALPAVRSALEAYNGPDGVRLNAATWVVTARRAD